MFVEQSEKFVWRNEISFNLFLTANFVSHFMFSNFQPNLLAYSTPAQVLRGSWWKCINICHLLAKFEVDVHNKIERLLFFVKRNVV